MRPAGLLASAVLLVGLSFGTARARSEEGASPPARPPAHADPWKLLATPDGGTLFVACGPRREVAVIDVPRREVVRRISVGGTPRSLALSPDGQTLAVSLDPEDEVVLLSLPSLEVARRLEAPRAPEGLAFDGSGRRLFVAGKMEGVVAVLDLGTGHELSRAAAGREPFALARSPDGTLVAAVSRRVAVDRPDRAPHSDVTLFDARTLAVLRRVELPSFHFSEELRFTADGRTVLAPGLRVRNLLPIVQVARGWVVSPSLAWIDVENGDASLLPLQDVNGSFADPGGLAVSRDGRWAWVASGGNDRVARLDLLQARKRLDRARPGSPEDFTLTASYRGEPSPVGANPRGLVFLGRGEQGEVAVSERLDDAVALLDPEGRLVARIGLGGPEKEDRLHRGERAFFDASVCFQHQFSCTSCHPEGHTDGLTYDFDIDGVGREIVLNRSLLGLAGTAPFKWSGLNPTIQRQCGARFAMVLTRADLMPKDVLDDLADWLLSRPPPRPLVDEAKADAATRAAIERGRRLFERSRRKDGTPLRPSQRCISCHTPPHYTNHQKTDVGTRSPYDNEGAFDTPHLVGIGAKAPYLHDGRALTLESIFTEAGAKDRHGFTSDLSPEDLHDLVLFLESL